MMTWSARDARRRRFDRFALQQYPPPGPSAETSGIVWRKELMTVQTKAPESQFAYVVLAARRARQIMAGAPPLIENPRTQKATRVACEELEQGLLEFDVPEANSVDEDKDGNKRKK